jgi:hypothetical protein
MLSILEQELKYKPRNLSSIYEMVNSLPDFQVTNDKGLPDFVFVESGANTYEVKNETQPVEEEKKQGYNAHKLTPKHNAIFEMYYKGLKILKEDEWDAFYDKLKEPLDICFRINSIE